MLQEGLSAILTPGCLDDTNTSPANLQRTLTEYLMSGLSLTRAPDSAASVAKHRPAAQRGSATPVAVTLALLLFLLFSQQLPAVPPENRSEQAQLEVVISGSDTRLTHFDMSYFVDDSAVMPFSQVRQQTFTPSDNTLSLGKYAKTAWSQVRISNHSGQPQRLFLHFPYAYHNREVAFYEQQGEGFLRHQVNLEAADNSPYMYRGIAVFEFHLAEGESKALYVKSVSYMRQWFTLEIFGEAQSRRALTGLGAHLDIALMVGAILALIVYNILLFLASNKKENIFYSLYLISAMVWISANYGLFASLLDLYGPFYLWPNLALMAMLVFLVCFMMDIFQTATRYRTEHRILQVLLAGLCLHLAYGLFDLVGAIHAVSTTAVLMLLTTISVTLSLLKKGNPLAGFFLAGHSMLALCGVVSILFYRDILGFSYLSTRALGIGIILEALTLAFVIAYRIKVLEAIKASQDELRLQAITDPLTQLYNRRYFFTEANYLMERAKTTAAPLSLLILDIDSFKEVNDTYGHPIGDKVIAALASMLRKQCREGDLIARLGGEEFVVMLPQTHQQGAEELAEALRNAIQKCRIPLTESPPLSFTVSIGGLAVDCHRETLETALSLADIALYEAKHAGKNCVRFSRCKPSEFDQEQTSY